MHSEKLAQYHPFEQSLSDEQDGDKDASVVVAASVVVDGATVVVDASCLPQIGAESASPLPVLCVLKYTPPWLPLLPSPNL
jgi:hypothetical protein